MTIGYHDGSMHYYIEYEPNDGSLIRFWKRIYDTMGWYTWEEIQVTREYVNNARSLCHHMLMNLANPLFLYEVARENRGDVYAEAIHFCVGMSLIYAYERRAAPSDYWPCMLYIEAEAANEL